MTDPAWPPRRMAWYWNMDDGLAAWFFAGLFVTIYVAVYLVLGLTVWPWTYPPIFFVPAWAGIAVFLGLSVYNVRQLP